MVEIERRRLFAEKGYSSMFDYVVRGLKYSEPAAARRINSARVLAKCPGGYQMLIAREVILTTLSMVYRLIEGNNGQTILESIKGK